jgi:hypothetical protein
VDAVAVDTAEHGPRAGDRATSRLPRPPAAPAVLAAALALPLVVALAVLHAPRWYPLLDWAQTEIRVRDVTSSHPPLIGLAGRIGPFGPDGGSHPGPLSFYALWPVWQLLGGSSYGLIAGTVLLDVVAIGLAVWMAYRRGGVPLALALATVLAVLMRAYGAFMLTLPWNPYLPALWWFVFLLALWSVLDGDLPMVPVAVFASTFCIQTHISYVGLVGGLSAFLAAVFARSAYRHRADTDARRRHLRWGVAGAAMLLVFWTPPVIDQVVHDPGNLEVIRDHFGDPPEDPIGLGEGVDVFLTQLNPLRLFGTTLVSDGDQRPVEGSRLPGALLVAAWAASAAAAWRMRERLLARLHVVVGLALPLGLASAARIFGDVWFYLLLWAWALTALMSFTIAWTAVAFARRTLPPDAAARYARAGGALLAGGLVAVLAVFTNAAARVDVMSPRLNAQLAALTPPTVDALASLERQGRRGPYLVTWLPEAQSIGAPGYGLLNELLREGFDAKAGEVFRPGATRYHVIDPAAGTLQVHLATGVDIACWRSDARYGEVAYYEPKSPGERVEFDVLHAGVLADLEALGLASELGHEVDDNLFMLALSPRVPAQTRARMERMLELGLPAAVFIGPIGERPHATAPGCP